MIAEQVQSSTVSLTLRGGAGDIVSIANHLKNVLPILDMGNTALMPDGAAILMLLICPLGTRSNRPSLPMSKGSHNGNGTHRRAANDYQVELRIARRQRDHFLKERDEIQAENIKLKARIEALEKAQNSGRKWLTVKEVAAKTGLPQYSIYRYCNDGHWRGVKAGYTWLIAADQEFSPKGKPKHK